MTRVARAVLEPGSIRIPPVRMRVPNCGHQGDPGMTGRRLEGVCGSEIGRPAVHAAHPLRLARKLQMHRMENQETAAEARGDACKRSLKSACGKFSRRSTRGFDGRQQGSRPPGECRAAPGVATRDSCYSGGCPGSAPAAAATRGSARSSAAAAPLPNLCASSSGVLPACSRGEGRGAGRRAPETPLRAPHPVLSQGVHPRGREEEGDDGGVAIASRRMQRGVASLQGRGKSGREEGGRDVRGDAGGRGTRPGGRRGGAAGESRGPQRGTLD